ncbi:nuclear transport factor 2 family protein [Novosphingobium sp. BL-52-GroH]
MLMTDTDVLVRNESAVRAFLDGMERQDEALVRSGLHDDVILRLPRPGLAHRTIEGGDNLARFVTELSQTVYVEPQASTDMLLVSQTHAVAEWRLRAKLVHGGDYDQFYCWTFDLADGAITEIREYIDTAYGMEKNGQVGRPAIERHS